MTVRQTIWKWTFARPLPVPARFSRENGKTAPIMKRKSGKMRS